VSGNAVPIRDYALLGDGRTTALVSREGSIDWLCLPDLDSPSVLGRILDDEKGGQLALRLPPGCESSRRYVPDTNVLETTFRTGEGVVRVTDALTLPDRALSPLRELVRRFECLSGDVEVGWTLAPRFDYGRRRGRIEVRRGVAIAHSGSVAVAVVAGGGEPEVRDEEIGGRIALRQGEEALLTLVASHQEPLVLPSPPETLRRLEATIDFWREWASSRAYEGPWRGAVVRSALLLKLLVYAPSGAVAAAPTTSLPEQLGGGRNWDYRFCWVRDSAFTLDSLLSLGCGSESHAFFWWLMHASQLTHPRLQVLYRLDGRTSAQEQTLPLAGYAGSAPVRIGNGAVDQLQLDVYGDLLRSVWLYVGAGNSLDRDTARRVARIADHVATIWETPDSGIWEVRSAPIHFTQSKLMCWIALDRALALADAEEIPARHAARWRRERDRIAEFVETRCWWDEEATYRRAVGVDEVDASLLLGVICGYGGGDADRLSSTVEAVRRQLAYGPFVRRYSGDDGLEGGEGAFVTCSFWLADALARIGRIDDAAALMEELLACANDVGLYAEEIDPESGDFLGNFPQGLTHLALIGAATSCAERLQ
jgi:GH15 family glucan-1,4-alpha-glucosidase